MRLCLNTHAAGVEMKSPGVIASVLAVDTTSRSQRMRFGGKVFVDCTGDGVVGVAAGAGYRHGREPRSMYNSRWLRRAATRRRWATQLRAPRCQKSRRNAQSRRPGRCGFPRDGFHPAATRDLGQYRVAVEDRARPGTQDTYRDAEEIRDELFELVYGMWDRREEVLRPARRESRMSPAGMGGAHRGQAREHAG